MSGIEPELWVEHTAAAVEHYRSAFGATVLHLVGEGDDLVAQLEVGGARFWVSAADPTAGRLSPLGLGGATGRTLLVVEEPAAVLSCAVQAGATELSPVAVEHGWLVARIVDRFGHEWEIGRPSVAWPPAARPKRT